MNEGQHCFCPLCEASAQVTNKYSRFIGRTWSTHVTVECLNGHRWNGTEQHVASAVGIRP